MIRIGDTGDFADTIGLLRRLTGRTQGAVGNDIGATASRIGEYEHDRRSMTVRTAIRLLDALGYQLAIVPREDL